MLDGPSPLYPLVDKFIKDEWVALNRAQLEPWAFFNAGHGLQVCDFYGKPISYSGVAFDGSPVRVFWSRYIEPFLEDIAFRAVDLVLRASTEREIDARRPLLETQGLLCALNHMAFDRMTLIDRRLRTHELHSDVAARGTDVERLRADTFVDARIKAELRGLEYRERVRFGAGMPLTSLMNDSVEIRKLDGTVVSGLKASVQGKRIFMDAGTVTLEPGDTVIRKPSVGKEERYRILDPGFYEAFHDIPAHYQMTVERAEPMDNIDDISEQRRAELFQQWDEVGVDIIKGDLIGGGSRYVGGPPSTRRLAMQWVKLKDAERDAKPTHHINVTGANSRVNLNSTDNSVNAVVRGDLFGSIREALNAGVSDSDKRIELQDALKALSDSTDAKGFWSHYQRFVAAAADHMTLISPFLPALTTFAATLSTQ